MVRLLLALPAFLVLSLSVHAGTSGPQDLSFVPSARNGACAVVVVLHGTGQAPRQVFSPWKHLARNEGFAVLAPAARSRDGWTVPEDGPQVLVAKVEEFRRRANGDARRIYLFGHSAGGTFALYMGLLESSYFAAVVAHGSAFGGETAAVPDAHRSIPILMLIGERDNYFTSGAADASVRALRAAGARVEFRVIAGHGHAFEERDEALTQTAWEFFTRQRLNASTNGVQSRDARSPVR